MSVRGRLKASIALVVALTAMIVAMRGCVRDVRGEEPLRRAPIASFLGVTNGFVDQRQFELDRSVFGARERGGIQLNHFSCVSCHFSPTDGGGSEVVELRVGRFQNGVFSDGRLVHLAVDSSVVRDRILPSDNVRSLRLSLSLFGLGFVEAIGDETLLANVASQPASRRGLLFRVNLSEAPGKTRIGRFGHKSQIASIPSFVIEAGEGEIGEDSEVGSEDELAESRFIRSLPVPPRDFRRVDPMVVARGERLLVAIGCGDCHTPSFTTLPSGSLINGGEFRVSQTHGGRLIHPYSDFAIHDLGDDLVDGIVQNGPPSSRRGVRTSPLWGLGARILLLHDGRAVTRLEAIRLHGGQAVEVIAAFDSLPPADQNAVLAVLESL